MSLYFFPAADPIEQSIRDKAQAFVASCLRPKAIEDDELARFRRDAFDTLAKAGLVCLAIPEHYGGGGMPSRCYYACLEELARGSLSMAITVGVTNLVTGAIAAFGNDIQKQKYLTKLARGEWLGAFSLSEPGAGSDAASLKLSAKKESGGYLLNGTKSWCSSAGAADLYLVMARTSETGASGISSFLVPKQTDGFRIGKPEKKLGMRASPLAELVFENCFIPDEQRLANEGDGFKVALSQLDSGRISIGTAGCGLTMEALSLFWENHLPEVLAQQTSGTKEILAGHFASLTSIRSLVITVAELRDKKEPITLGASAVKLLGSDLAMQVTSDVVSFLGEKGYTRELGAERLMRDAKSLQIVEGTNQIQRVVIARALDSMTGKKTK